MNPSPSDAIHLFESMASYFYDTHRDLAHGLAELTATQSIQDQVRSLRTVETLLRSPVGDVHLFVSEAVWIHLDDADASLTFLKDLRTSLEAKGVQALTGDELACAVPPLACVRLKTLLAPTRQLETIDSARDALDGRYRSATRAMLDDLIGSILASGISGAHLVDLAAEACARRFDDAGAVRHWLEALRSDG